MDCHPQKRMKRRTCAPASLGICSLGWKTSRNSFQGEEPTQLQGDISELFTLLPCINNLSSVPSKSQPSLRALEEAGQGGFDEGNWSNLVVTMQLLNWWHLEPPLPSGGWRWAGCPEWWASSSNVSPICREKLTTQSLMNSLSLHNNTLCSTSN